MSQDPEQESCQPSSSNNTDTRCNVSFNAAGQPDGEESAKLATQIGCYAMSNVSPLISSWDNVPRETLDILWRLIQGRFNVPDHRREYCLQKASTAWKNWKYRLRQGYFLTGQTDAERKQHKTDKWVKQEDWEAFVDLMSRETQEEHDKHSYFKAMRAKMTSPHTTGRKGVARKAEELKRKRGDGQPLSRTDLYISSHTREDGSAITPHDTEAINQIKRLIELDESYKENDIAHDAVTVICGKDKRGRVRGLGAGVSKTSLRYSAPYQSRLDKVERELFTVAQKLEMVIDKQNSSTQPTMGSSSHFEAGYSPQERHNSSVPDVRPVPTPSPSPCMSNNTRCYLKNFLMTRSFASGLLLAQAELADPDYYEICIEEIFDITAVIQDRNLPEGSTFADVCIGEVLRWPKNMTSFIL